MPKRVDIEKILIIGAGPIIIGQACEFDYSGVQACRALRQEGYKVILINSNPATIMTDPTTADAIYIEPINVKSIEAIIAKERPDALLSTMGGQTALNISLALLELGILEKYGVELIGARKEAIEKAENRDSFKKAMEKIGLKVPKAKIAHSYDEALVIQQEIGFPTIIRPSYTLGGSGGGIAYNLEEFQTICLRGLDLSPTNELLIEQSIIGYKEYEMEVVRDCEDNCIIVCSIENLDPMGVHTGDSITVAPAQTLTDKEYQQMRNASIAVLREIGVDTGGSNVQFAVNPDNGELFVIEMNPRVSRSSALASKATGFPIAKVAAKLAVGFTLNELRNEITGDAIPASFEPTIDYVVTKIPRFAFEKFKKANPVLTTQMKSVGEAMAIGRTFPESIQKALRSLETNLKGFDSKGITESQLGKSLSVPKAGRILAVAEAFRRGYSLEKIHSLSQIDEWFLSQIQNIVELENSILGQSLEQISKETLLKLKRMGFGDAYLAEKLGTDELTLRKHRKALGIIPAYKQIDSCAAEFASPTSYYYSTYEPFCESIKSDKQKIIILGSGPNRIGQGIEFDYCCVHASLALKHAGFESIMINCNPETVSTDYDISSRLYFEPLVLEHVLDVIDLEKPFGVIVQYGGQTPLKLAEDLEQYGVNIIGTSPTSIDLTEDREQFKNLLDELKLKQPKNAIAFSEKQALSEAEKIGFPILVRPSYVLGGRAMEIIYNLNELQKYMQTNAQMLEDGPLLLDRYLTHAIELDVDVIRDGKRSIIAGIMQHIEQAGVHSGDSACSLPTYSVTEEQKTQIIAQAKALAEKLNVIGLMNVQFAINQNQIYILEVNPRASRTIPFVSKSIGVPIAKIGALAMAGIDFDAQGLPNIEQFETGEYFSVKEAVFPFNKFPEEDPILGPEMKSTGEVMGIAKTFVGAFAKAQMANSESLKGLDCVFISVTHLDKPLLADLTKELMKLKPKRILATGGTYKKLVELGIECERINKVYEGRPHIVDAMVNNEVDFVINTDDVRFFPEDSAKIRQMALKKKIPMATTMPGAMATLSTFAYDKFNEVIDIKSINIANNSPKKPIR